MDEISLMSLHEAGHWTVAQKLGFRVSEIRCHIPAGEAKYTGTAGIYVQQDFTSVSDSITYLERYITVLYSGTLAEHLGDDNKVDPVFAANPELRHVEHQLSFQSLTFLRNLKWQSLSGSYDQQIDTLARGLVRDTIAVVEENAGEIRGVANQLIDMIAKANGKEVVFTADIAPEPVSVENESHDEERTIDPKKVYFKLDG